MKKKTKARKTRRNYKRQFLLYRLRLPSFISVRRCIETEYLENWIHSEFAFTEFAVVLAFASNISLQITLERSQCNKTDSPSAETNLLHPSPLTIRSNMPGPFIIDQMMSSIQYTYISKLSEYSNMLFKLANVATFVIAEWL